LKHARATTVTDPGKLIADIGEFQERSAKLANNYLLLAFIEFTQVLLKAIDSSFGPVSRPPDLSEKL